jgi:hypothetical protein
MRLVVSISNFLQTEENTDEAVTVFAEADDFD